MSVSPADFLQLAEQLSVEESEEINYQSSVSRAYYAAFLMAREVLVLTDPNYRLSSESHNDVWNRFANDFDKNRESLMEKGMRLKTARKISDYMLSNTVNYRDSLIAIAQAKEIMKLLTAIRESARPRNRR